MALVWHFSPVLAPSGAAEQQKVAPGKGGGRSLAGMAPTGEGRGGEGPGSGGSRGLRRCAPGFCSFLPGRGGVRPAPQRGAAQLSSAAEEKRDRRQQLASHPP